MRDVTVLVTQAQSGDRQALGALVEAVQDDIWRLQLSRTGSVTDAEDATQETFVQMVASFRELRDPRAFAGWLYRIALNQARMAGRRRVTDARALETMASTSQETREEDAMERNELRQAVRQAVAGLEENLRATLELRYEHGLAYADIARAMDCPLGTVADRLHSAHERLKRALAGAGVAITMALLEGELSAAPRTVAPPRLAARVAKVARDTPLASSGPLPTGPRPRLIAAGLFSALLLAVFVAWWLSRPPKIESSQPFPFLASQPNTDPSSGRVSDPTTGALVNGNHLSPHEAAFPPNHGRLVGRVFDRDSKKPVAGAEIVLTPSLTDPSKLETRKAVSARSNEEGRFSVDAEPGKWGTDARAQGFVWYSAERMIAIFGNGDAGSTDVYLAASCVTLAPGLESARDFELVRGVRLRGHVVDDLGLAVVGARVAFGVMCPANGGRIGLADGQFHGTSPVLTDTDGRFEFDGIWPGGELNYVVTREGFVEGRASLTITPEAPETKIALIRRPGIRVWGTVRDLAGNALSGAQIYAGNDTFLKRLEGSTDDLGRFDFPFVSSGHLAIAWAQGRGPALLALDSIPPGGLEARLPVMDGRIAGHVVDEKGHPVAGMTVSVLGIGARSDAGTGWLLYQYASVYSRGKDEVTAFLPPDLKSPEAKTTEDGAFSFDGLCVGSGFGVKLTAKRDGYSREIEVFEPGDVKIVVTSR